MAIDSTKIAKVKTAMDNRYENKQANKKTDISGDYSEDTSSYPTVGAVQSYVEGKGYITSHQDISGKEDSSNKVTTWSSTTTNTRYPSEKLVKDSLDGKISTSNTVGLVKNDGTIDTNTYLTEHQSLSNYIQKSNTEGFVKNDGTIDTTTYLSQSSTTGLVKNDGTIDTNTYLTEHQDLSNYIQKDSTNGLVKNDGTIDTTTYLTTHQDISGKANSADLATVATSGKYTDLENIPATFTPSSHMHGSITNDGRLGTEAGKPLITTTGGEIAKGSFGTSAGTFAEGNHTHAQYLTSHQSLSDIGGEVTVEKQQTAETGYAHTYVVKQNGSQVGAKINIPKDLLLKSATKEVVGDTPNTIETDNNLVTGDVYLKFIVNTEDNDNATTLIIPVNDLVEDTTYTAGSGLTLNDGEFSISNGNISLSMLSNGVQTSLGYADTFNSSPASGITSTQISSWDSMASTGTNIEDIDARINQALDDLAELIYPTSNS